MTVVELVSVTSPAMELLTQLPESCSELQSDCCSILAYLVEQVYSQQQLQQCAVALQPILARLSECLDSNAQLLQPCPPLLPRTAGDRLLDSCVGSASTATVTAANKELKRVLRMLTVDAPVPLHAMLAIADPLPSGELQYLHPLDHRPQHT